METRRALHWDPKKEKFQNDDAANAMLSRPQRAPYVLPKANAANLTSYTHSHS
jgi:hypothetical protein